MRSFDEQLLRLKQALKVTEDQDVATTLGMTKAAFSARKARGAFPEDKLYALVSKRPELCIDARYIVTGISDELERRLSSIRVATEIASHASSPDERRKIQEHAFEELVGTLSQDEQRLLHDYRRSDQRGKEAIRATAASMAALAASDQETAASTPADQPRRTRRKVSKP